jgi:hypothetical protein
VTHFATGEFGQPVSPPLHKMSFTEVIRFLANDCEPQATQNKQLQTQEPEITGRYNFPLQETPFCRPGPLSGARNIDFRSLKWESITHRYAIEVSHHVGRHRC